MTVFHRFATTCASLILLAAAARADTIKLVGGGEMHGVVIDRDADPIPVRMKTGTLYVSKSQIVSIVKDDAVVRSNGELPSWDRMLSFAVQRDWGRDAYQIPSTVVTEGSLGNVPYLSYKAGDYEFNIYGDPDHPAGVEIGCRNDLIADVKAQQNCLDFIAVAVGEIRAAAVLAKLDHHKDLRQIAGLKYEITPPTDPDAEGGWWVSVYDEQAIEMARASAKELADITVAVADLKKQRVAAAQANIPPKGKSLVSGGLGAGGDWTTRELNDIGHADNATENSSIPSATSAPRTQTVPSPSPGGRVYVRGYTRKDGTYVHAHTRRS